MQPRWKKKRAISETETAQGPGPSHPFQSTPTDIKNSHIGQRQDTNTSEDSLQDPLFDEADTLVWDPEDDLGGEEMVVIRWNYVKEDEDVTQVMFYLEFLYENIFLELPFPMYSGVLKTNTHCYV